MKLLEYEAKCILKRYNVPTPASKTLGVGRQISVTHPPLPLVVKSQVPVGGRGKAGGIVLTHNSEEFDAAIAKVAETSIRGYTPKTILLEQALDIERELYLSLVINRSAATIDLAAHPSGGIEIESQTGFFTKLLSPKSLTSIGESLAELYRLESHSFALADLVENLYQCFVENDATLLEINPLILTKQGELMAGDCKMTLDDDAAFRHPEWEFEERPTGANFVSLDQQGTVATIANGAGLAMATVDAIKAAGLSPANFLDIGGGATVDGIVSSFSMIMEFPRVEAVIINIFGGIVRCDDVAKAIVEAKKQFSHLPSLYIRLSGTNSEEAAKLLQREGLTLYPDLAACIKGVTHE